MKKLLLSCLLLVGFSSFAQTTCATAVNITTASSTITTPSYSSASTYSATCYGGATGIRAIWYKYTPTANGEITVNSGFTGNTNNGTTYTDDTRVSILKGTCTALTCVDSNDDISNTNYLSSVTVPVAAGTTYYIQWDNYWYAGDATNQAKPLKFTFNFVATPCVRPGAADFYRPDSYTTTSANLYWNQSIGAPANYDVDWSIGLSDAAGTGTLVSVPAGTLAYAVGSLTGIPESTNFRYYVRSNCGTTQSAWQGPFYGYLAVPLPYSNAFDSATNNYTDGFIGFSLLGSSTTATPPITDDSGTGSVMFTPNSTSAVSNRWAYSRALNLAAGEQVTLNFKTKLYAQGTTIVTPMTLQVTVGNAQSTAAQTTTVGSVITTSSDTAFTAQSVTWTAPTAGVYYFGFNNNSPVGATQTYLFLDTLDISSVLSNNNYLLSKLSVFPNPAKNIVTIANDSNVIVNAIEMTDLNGRVVKSMKVNAAQTEVSVSDLAVGVYMMKITTDQGIATKKLIKE
jgi:hypothetical protein